uniref:Uncharacterized protein n=1 Tax=Dictyostelium purpureum TaxID=5786 RepID=B2Y1U0_DICPU|nr:hypothetical protein [Dictyostelium purpureum]
MDKKLLNYVTKYSVEVLVVDYVKNQLLLIIGAFVFIGMKITFGYENIDVNGVSFTDLNSYIILSIMLFKIICWKFDNIKNVNILVNIVDSFLIVGGIIVLLIGFNKQSFYYIWNGIYITNMDPIFYKFEQIIQLLLDMGISEKEIQKYYSWEEAQTGLQNVSYLTLEDYSKEMYTKIKESIIEEENALKELIESKIKENTKAQESNETVIQWIKKNKLITLGIIGGSIAVTYGAYCIGYKLGFNFGLEIGRNFDEVLDGVVQKEINKGRIPGSVWEDLVRQAGENSARIRAAEVAKAAEIGHYPPTLLTKEIGVQVDALKRILNTQMKLKTPTMTAEKLELLRTKIKLLEDFIDIFEDKNTVSTIVQRADLKALLKILGTVRDFSIRGVNPEDAIRAEEVAAFINRVRNGTMGNVAMV